MFKSAKSKVERANKNIADFEAVHASFWKTDPYTISVQNDPQFGAISVNVTLKQNLPVDFSLAVGDILNNLSTALDHATWELIGLDGGTQDRWAKFPTGRLRRDYEASCNGIKTPGADTKTFFASLAAYPEGVGESLYHLHSLNNVDKHVTVTPVIGASKIDRIEIIPKNMRPIMIDNASLHIGEDGVSRFRTRLLPGGVTKVDPNAKATIEILFGDVEFVKFKRVIPTLLHFRNAVSDCIGEFEHFVSTRS